MFIYTSFLSVLVSFYIQYVSSLKLRNADLPRLLPKPFSSNYFRDLRVTGNLPVTISCDKCLLMAKSNDVVTNNKSQNTCSICKGKEVVSCNICAGTGRDKVNGSVLERWCCKKCKVRYVILSCTSFINVLELTLPRFISHIIGFWLNSVQM